MKDMVYYQDDIYICATYENELKKKTDIILDRLGTAGITINEKNASTIAIILRQFHFKL